MAEDNRRPIYLLFKETLDMIPNEFTQRTKVLEDIGSNEALDLRDELNVMKKSFFYRRKKYRDESSPKATERYMAFVHDVMVRFVQIDQKIMEGLEDE